MALLLDSGSLYSPRGIIIALTGSNKGSVDDHPARASERRSMTWNSRSEGLRAGKSTLSLGKSAR